MAPLSIFFRDETPFNSTRVYESRVQQRVLLISAHRMSHCWFNHVQPSVFSPHGSHMFPTCSRPFPPECSPSFPTIPLHFPPFSPAVSTSARPCISRSPGSCWPSRRMAHCFADRGQNWSRIYHYSMVNILMINIWLVNDD